MPSWWLLLAGFVFVGCDRAKEAAPPAAASPAAAPAAPPHRDRHAEPAGDTTAGVLTRPGRRNGALVVDTTPPPEGWPEVTHAPGCPSGMARVEGVGGDVCIHRFEVSLTSPREALSPRGGPVMAQGRARFRVGAGLSPSYGVTWYQAASACRANGFHLCTSQEWEDACDGTPGPGGRAHPVADATSADSACNIRHAGDGTLSASGHSPGCHTPEGVYDLEGNLWEWVDPGKTAADGTPVTDKRGGGYYSATVATCGQAAVGGHRPDWDGTIGFRCCVAAK